MNIWQIIRRLGPFVRPYKRLVVFSLLLTLVGLGGILNLFGFVIAVAAIVYLVDVRPAVRGMRPGGPWG